MPGLESVKNATLNVELAFAHLDLARGEADAGRRRRQPGTSATLVMSSVEPPSSTT